MNDSTACHVFHSLFSALLITYLRSDPSLHYLRVLALTCPQSSALLIDGLHRFLSRRQLAPNKLCAINNDVHLITRFYGT